MRQKVHFIGIGGIGTSALSRWFLKCGWQVSGSDIIVSSITRELKKQGVKIFIGHRAQNLSPKTNLVIYTGAASLDNPEIKKAGKLGIPVKSYAQALGNLTKEYKTLAVTGAHGKTTTTAMLSLVLMKAGLDPTVIIGAKLKEFGGSTGSAQGNNFRNGKGDYLVIEADEHLESFLNYSPFAAIITNIDKDHLDYYKNLTNIKSAFLKFIKNIQPNGILVLNEDDKNLSGLRDKIKKIAQKNKIRLFWYGTRVNPRLTKRLSASLKIIGEHNVSNALGVYALARVLKIKEKEILKALSDYRGAGRRMEYKGMLTLKANKAKKLKAAIYDDYAHHPVEIKATLAGIARKWPKKGLICVFQPHQTKRLALLFKGFTEAFFEANYLILLDVYQVAGRDRLSHGKKKHSVAKYQSSKNLAEAIPKRISNSKLKPKTCKLKAVQYLPYPKRLKQVLTNLVIDDSCFTLHDSYIIVMMGAGDIYELTDKLVKNFS